MYNIQLDALDECTGTHTYKTKIINFCYKTNQMSVTDKTVAWTEFPSKRKPKKKKEKSKNYFELWIEFHQLQLNQFT